ncbi:MAG: metallopeptidase family protein [Elusimicrobia bacterium]|nr:metallopeptidase family protein [Elusimicrobiota bacterium]MBU2615197.1 metallopeptidase family protein [Elusimicrobiota bacterium]
MTFEEFENIIDQTLEKIPQQVKDILKEKQVAVVAREKAPDEMLQRNPGMVIFGAFIGMHYGRFFLANLQSEPTRVELYKDSFEMMFKKEEEINSQIERTVVHEIAHYLGFSEKQIRDLGY